MRGCTPAPRSGVRVGIFAVFAAHSLHLIPRLRHLQEFILSIIIGYDPTTLREKVDLLAAGERLAEIGDLRSLSALNEKTVLLRLVGRLDDAWDVANEAVRQARFTGDRHAQLGARIRRAQVLHDRKKFDAAVSDLSLCADEARDRGWTSLEAAAVQNRGKAHFDNKNFSDALVDFKAAVFLHEKMGASFDELENSLIAVAVTESLVEW